MNYRICIPAFVLAFAMIVPIAIFADAPNAARDADGCRACHRDLKGKLQAPVGPWKGSAHARDGRMCTSCHGGRADAADSRSAKDPKTNFIGKTDKRATTEFCGRDGCHANVVAYFRAGRHAGSVKKAGEPNCVSCHGSHHIERSSARIMTESRCVPCHTPAFAKGVFASLKDADQLTSPIEADIEFLKKKSADTKDLDGKMASLRDHRTRMLHTLTRESMSMARGLIENEQAILKDVVRTKIAIVKRLDLIYQIIMIFCMCLILGFGVYRFRVYRRKAE
ncbi:MAG TPA: hypothetical protein PLE73_12265 [Spirochaetota bacterium]|nr:hypothetical protein [Spirochaetota bacterium]